MNKKIIKYGPTVIFGIVAIILASLKIPLSIIFAFASGCFYWDTLDKEEISQKEHLTNSEGNK